jgi:predicted lipoprotein with Yx(FWY)xxD motif
LYADKGAVGYGQQYTVITRTDGNRQWAYDNKPLYLYAGDAAAGDVLGDGLGGVWSAVVQ